MINRQTKISFIILFIGLLFCTSSQATTYSSLPETTSPLTSPNVAKALDWISTPGENLCGGYYREPNIVLRYPNPPAMKTAETTISAKDTGIFSNRGTSTLIGNVLITQQGRQITADKAQMTRNAKTGKTEAIDLFGNVHFREKGRLIVSDDAHLKLPEKTAVLNNAIYRTEKGDMNAWGKAKKIDRKSTDILDLQDTTYTTCSPQSSLWHIAAKKLHLDREKGTGTAKNATLYAGEMPIFYTPYLNFPIDKRRKSGFLLPTFGTSSGSGAEINAPYYLNLAPNYDATLSPRFMSKRGVQANTLFRYLQSNGKGNMFVSYLPYDKAFENFKNTAKTDYAGNAALPDLEKANDNRGFFSLQDDRTYNPHWLSSLQLNYTTDNYYFRDFGGDPNISMTDQLLNQAGLNYNSDHWHLLTQLQSYQTLHRVDQLNPSENQYSLLPGVDLDAFYPNQPLNLTYQFNGEFMNFEHSRDFLTNDPVVEGNRMTLQPGISVPLYKNGFYLTPNAQLSATAYSLHNQTIGNPSEISRTLPIFSVDSGTFFSRDTRLFRSYYQQTLEPRIFYLFVPRENQDDIPIFDTQLPPFSFEQLFHTNRFTSYDRLGDANQVSMALTSRLLDSNSGQEKLRASIGQIYYFQDRKVCLTPDCSNEASTTDSTSPIASELAYYFTDAWNALANAAWDPNNQRIDNAGLSIQYQPDKLHLFNVGYDYVRGGDLFNGDLIASTSKDNLNRIYTSFASPVTQHWNLLGSWQYNISHDYSQAYLYGLEYTTCCWAMRFIASRAFIGLGPNNGYQFERKYYVQLQLKGLGNIGNSNPRGLLEEGITDYHDNFSGNML